MVRKLRYIRKRLIKGSPEVKYLTHYLEGHANKVHYASPAVGTLWGEQHVKSNILAISQGTGFENRIGQKIYVKFLTVRLWVRACPSADSYNVGPFSLRCIVSDTGNLRVSEGTTVTGYFKPAIHRNIFGMIDRSYITPKYDRMYYMTSNSWISTATFPDAFCGPAKMIQFKVPIGRVVEFQGNTTAVKNDKDYLSLMMLVGVPSMSSATNIYQIACTDAQIRVYFTDM